MIINNKDDFHQQRAPSWSHYKNHNNNTGRLYIGTEQLIHTSTACLVASPSINLDQSFLSGKAGDC